MVETSNEGIALLGALLFFLGGVFTLYRTRRIKEGKKDLFGPLRPSNFWFSPYYPSTTKYEFSMAIGIICVIIFCIIGIYLIIKGAFSVALVIASAVFFSITYLQNYKVIFHEIKKKGSLDYECPECREALYGKEQYCPHCKTEFIEDETISSR